MRALLAAGALLLLVLTSPIAAGDKRAVALAVRVTVVRSCSVSTDPGSSPGGIVNCGSRFGPPAISTSSTIRVPLSAPQPRVDSTSLPGVDAPARSAGPAQAAPGGESPEAVAATAAPQEPSSDAAGSNDAQPARGRGAGPARPAAGADAQTPTVPFRLITVNF